MLLIIAKVTRITGSDNEHLHDEDDQITDVVGSRVRGRPCAARYRFFSEQHPQYHTHELTLQTDGLILVILGRSHPK